MWRRAAASPPSGEKLITGHIQGRVQSSPDQENVNIVEPNHDLAGLM
ncbi:hypothetical protein [Streptomyces platensis]